MKLIWLMGTAVSAYIAGCILVMTLLLKTPGPTPVRDFLIMGGVYTVLVAPATYAVFAMIASRMGSEFSLIGYVLWGAICGTVPSLLFWAVSGSEGRLFVIMLALHGIPAGAILGLGYSIRKS